MNFEEYVNKIANGLQEILTAKITVNKQISFTSDSRYEFSIWIDYKNRSYALTPFFCENQYKNNEPIDDAIHNGFISLREEVIRDFGIGQLVDFQKVR